MMVEGQENEADDAIDKLTVNLLSRQKQALIVHRLSPDTHNVPVIAQTCHENAHAWVNQNPKDGIIPGWLYIDLSSPLVPLLEGGPRRIELLAHSIIRKSDGTLIDITPVKDKQAAIYPFISHPEGILDFFSECIELRKISRIRMYLAPARLVYLAV